MNSINRNHGVKNDEHFSAQRVLSVHHWNDTLFSFRTTRDPGLRFINGQFVMIGLPQEGGAR
jgi:ferredoxin--NADP+ reductase